MTYSMSCTTKLIFSDEASVDLTREAGGLPAGPVFVITDDGVAKAGLAAPLVEALRATGRAVEVFSAVPSNPGVADVRARGNLAFARLEHGLADYAVKPR